MILAVIVFAALIYFNVDVRSIVDSLLNNPVIQKIWVVLISAWTNYLVPLGGYIWESILGLFQ